VLEYIIDIKTSYIDETDFEKGFKLMFEFKENPFFDHKELVKEYHMKEGSPWTGEIEVEKITATQIEWKAGKNVTEEVTKKKVKGGGAKKAKQKSKETVEPRESFFRLFFQELDQEKGVPEGIRFLLDEENGGDDDEEEDEDEWLGMFMDNDHEVGTDIKDSLIPYAVRWYTGEACPEDEGDDEDDEDDEDDDDEDEDDDEDDEDEDDEPTPKKGAKGKAKASGKKGGGGQDGNQEECKQQ